MWLSAFKSDEQTAHAKTGKGQTPRFSASLRLVVLDFLANPVDKRLALAICHAPPDLTSIVFQCFGIYPAVGGKLEGQVCWMCVWMGSGGTI